jgi:lipopolysaccharide export system protein LptA
MTLRRMRSMGSVLVCLCVAAWRPGNAQEERRIDLEHADSLVGRVIDGDDVREFIGNVRIIQGNVRIACDRAVQFIRTGTVDLTGNVVVRDDSLTMRSPRGVYHKNERRAEAFEQVFLDDGTVQLRASYGEYWVDAQRAFFRDRVVVNDTASTLEADSLTYYRAEKRSVATGRVSITHTADNVTITGGHLDHEARTQYSRMTVAPVLTQLDTAEGGAADTLVVRSLVMESYRDSVKKLLAIDSVRIVRSDLAAVAGWAAFYTAGDSILLRTAPVVWYQKTQVTGDSINVYLRARTLHRVTIMGEAFALSQGDSLHPERFDQLTGDTMLLFFENQALDRIDVMQRAISVYHLYEDSLGNGLNKTSGDRIIVAFEKRKVRAITVIGGVEGQYVPEGMIKNHEVEYAIPGFVWRNDQRPRLAVLQAQPGPTP